MPRRWITGLIALVMCSATAIPATAGAPAARKACTDPSRACMIRTATTYLDALLSHDASQVRLATSARRTENGSDTGDGDAEIRKSLSPPTPDEVNTGIRDKRWFTTGDQAIVFYLLDTSTLPPSPLHTTTTHIVERFRINHGLITEIEAIFWIDPGPTEGGSGWPAPDHEADPTLPAINAAPPAESPAKWCRTASRQCEITAANSYLSAVASRDYRKTQLAAGVRRTQNGSTTAINAAGVRRNGQDPHPDAVITDIRGQRWWVAGDEVIGFSLADTSTAPHTSVHTGTVHLANRFKVVRGRLTQIESLYWIAPGPTPEPSGWEH
jgi:hypothetical protein